MAHCAGDRSDARGEAKKEAPEVEPWFALSTKTGVKAIHRVFMDNWQSGVTVAMVSVPLSISLGMASVSGDDPAAPAMGLATAFWGGLAASLFGSSDMNIVGPAGALSGMLCMYTMQFDGAGVLPYLSLISSVVIIAVYALNLQRYLLLMPKAVFEGFTLAVAVIIGMNQLNMALDLHPEHKHEHFHLNVAESFRIIHEATPFPTIFFIVNTALLLGLVKYLGSVRGYPIPWTVLIPLSTLLFGYFAETDNFGGLQLPTLKGKYGELEARLIAPLQPLSHFAEGRATSIVTASIGIAFVAILETLISAKIAEQKTGWIFCDSRETLGLAASHAVCGAVGAMPPTGVFVRTSLNMSLGATHRISQFINAVVVLFISVVAMPLFSYLPLASVAALLVFASVRMAPLGYISELWTEDKGSCALLLLTASICVFSDPVYGLIVGMVVALLRDAAGTARADAWLRIDTLGDDAAVVISAWADEFDRSAGLVTKPSRITALFTRILAAPTLDITKATCEKSPWESIQGAEVRYEPVGPLVYMGGDRHTTRIRALLAQRPARLVLSLASTTRIDMDGAESMGKAIQYARDAGVFIEVLLPEGPAARMIGQSAWVRTLRADGHVRSHESELPTMESLQSITV